MNNKQAKKLRKIARLLATRMELPLGAEYLTQNRTKKMNKADLTAKTIQTIMWPVTSVRLNPKSERFLYQNLKKEFAKMNSVSKRSINGSINEN